MLTMDCVALQNEKCHLLIENETMRLKHLDEQNNQLLKEWRDQLKPRKKVRATRFSLFAGRVSSGFPKLKWPAFEAISAATS